MATYYVKVGGNDTLDGSSDGNAWATVAKVSATTFTNGDVVCFNRDDEWEESLDINYSGVTYKDYGSGDLPKIRVAGTGYTAGIDNITLQNIHFDGGVADEPTIWAYRNSGWTIDGVTITNPSRTGIQMPSCSDVEIKNCTLTGNRALATGWRGVYIYAESTALLTGNVSIHDNTVNNWGGYGVHVLGYSYDYRCQNVNVYDNDLSHCGTGAYLSYCDTGTVHDNTCDDNLVGGDAAVEQYGIAFQTVSNFRVYGNHCTNGRCGMEIWAGDGTDPFPLSGSSDGNKVYDNVFAGNSEHGFLIYEGNADDTEIYYNEIYNNHFAGIAISENTSAGTGNYILNNSLYNNNQGGHGYADIYFGTANAGWTLRNNAIYAVTAYAFRSGNQATSATHTKNLYYKASGNVIDNHGTYYTTATITDFEATAKGADPLFVSIITPDLRIQSSSPCRDAGTDVGLSTDFDGYTLYGTPDIGAHEFQPPAVSVNLKNSLLDHTFRVVAYTPATNIYVALCKSTIDGADTGSTLPGEVSGGAYARTTCNTWDAASGGVTKNTGAVTFSQATASWGTITDLALVDASSGGNVLVFGKLTTTRTIGNTDVLEFPAGTLRVGIS